jgi:multidrug resistance efflux pump
VPGLETIPGTAPVEPIKREVSARTGPEIIREAKVKVLRNHYEETLSETIQLEKAALSASPEERSNIDAKAKAHRDFLGKLEADLDALATPPKTAAAEKSPPLKAIPGLDVPSSAETGPIPGGYQVPKARAELEKVKELEKSGLIGRLDVIKAETRLKWAEAHAVGDRAGAARATRDGARQRLELMQTLFTGGVVSAEEIDEVRRELRAADADLRVQLEAAGEGGSEGRPGAPPPARK